MRKMDGKTEHVNSRLDYLLQTRPNQFMSPYDFQYRIYSQLLLNENALIYKQYDGMGNLVALWPLDYASIENVDVDGELYIKFQFGGGKQQTVPYEQLIHIRRHFTNNDMYGDDMTNVITPTLSLLTTLKQGLINLVKNSVKLSGFLKFSNNLKQSDLKEKTTTFANNFKSMASETGGIAAVDNTADFHQLTSDIKSADNYQMDLIRQDVYRFFGLSDAIIKGTYKEDEWQAFFESIIEPLAIQMSQEFTAKIFSERELGYGNIILFDANRLQYASMANKTTMIKELMPLGLLTINQALEILNLPPVEDGDRRLQTLNVVDATKANKYQGVDDESKGGDTNE